MNGDKKMNLVQNLKDTVSEKINIWFSDASAVNYQFV